MGRIAINVADFPPTRRGVRFSNPENTRLVQEVRLRSKIIYGTKKERSQPHQVRLAWEEIAEIISSVSNTKRSADQCRKRFNDIKRRRRQMMVAGRKRGRPPKSRPKIDEVYSLLDPNQHVEPQDLEFEVQETIDLDDPDYEPVPKKRESGKVIILKEVPVSTPPQKSEQASSKPPAVLDQPSPRPPAKLDQPSPRPPAKLDQPSPRPPAKLDQASPKPPPKLDQASARTPAKSDQVLVRPAPKPLNRPLTIPSQNSTSSPSLPKPKYTVIRKPAGTVDPGTRQQQEDEKHPFLELQQAGFDMLKRELSGFRDSVMSLNTRLNHLEIALRPIGHIADSLSRVANAVERLTCPPE